MRATGHCPQMSHPQETIDVIREYLSTPVSTEAVSARMG